MEKLTQITFECTDEQFKKLDYIGIFDQVGVLFQSCRIMTGNAEPPIAEKLQNALKEKRGVSEVAGIGDTREYQIKDVHDISEIK